MGKILTLVAILAVPLIIVLLTLDLVAFNEKYYPKAFKKYNIYNAIGAPPQEIDAQAVNILKYIQSEEQLEGTLLNEKEKLHLADVQTLVTRGQQLLLIVIFIFLATWLPAENKRKIVFSGSLLTLAVIVVFSVVNFSDLFLLFHRVAFANDFWLLNPATDNLVKMYPEELFREVVIKTAIATTGIALFTIIFLQKKKR